MVSAAAAATLLTTQVVAGKTARDALFLTNFPVFELPKVMVGSAVLSIATAFLVSRLLTRLGPQRVLPVLCGLNAVLFVAEFVLAGLQAPAAAIAVYLHFGALGSLSVSTFWSLINERFDPHSAKRYVGRIAGGSALGGILGGLMAERATSSLGLASTLPALAIVNLLCMVALRGVGRPLLAHPDPDLRVTGLRSLGREVYLRQIALLVVLVSLTAALVEYLLKAQAAEAYRDPSRLAAFFAAFYSATSLLTFVVQSALTAPSLRRFGLAGTIGILPSAVVLVGLVGIAYLRLGTVVALTGLENTLRNSLFRSGYELLYTPIDPIRKRAVKTIIDVAFDRLGDILAAGLIMLFLALLTPASDLLAMVLALTFAVGSMLLSFRLNEGYVNALASSLRLQTVSLSDSEVFDATTRRTLTDTTSAIDRQQLLAEIQELTRREKRSDPLPVSEAARPPPAAGPAPTQPERAVELLLSNDTSSILQVLRLPKPDLRLVPFMLPLLARNDSARAVVKALRPCAGQITGQLVDTLLDPEKPHEIRRRVTRLLEAGANQRARDGLWQGLGDSDFEVRFACGQALQHLVTHNRELAPDKDRVFAAVARELERTDAQFVRDVEPLRGASRYVKERAARRAKTGLQHTMTLLSLVLDSEALLLSLRALESGASGLRGTALEYLENVLPESLYRAIQLRLGAEAQARKLRREQAQIVEDLHQSMSMLQLDRKALKPRK